MKPYYEGAGVTLWLGDCREVIPTLAPVDIVLTDPPWEVRKGKLDLGIPGGVGPIHRPATTIGEGTIGRFDPALISLCQQVATHDCLFLCGYKELGPVIAACELLRGVFGWHKPNGLPALFYPARLDLSFIVWAGRASHLYGRQHWPSMVFSVSTPIPGCMASERLTDEGGKALHPAQGPLELYQRLLVPFPPGLTLLDPYAGTGTSLVAAKVLGLKAVGVEIEERYAELAARRLDQGVFAFPEGPPCA